MYSKNTFVETNLFEGFQIDYVFRIETKLNSTMCKQNQFIIFVQLKNAVKYDELQFNLIIFFVN